ncbi:hypothetical protein QJS04_geneDACA015972 [Acorus gramineus]|uniref:Uncharacterized protein n=1 Tax=Acorus gramineus TaxID=55184 RepID=A0AAV9BGI2_ACOGR|nr:hypothetical protein QJS04_geneDACA015972 [Acorus gramineus]
MSIVAIDCGSRRLGSRRVSEEDRLHLLLLRECSHPLFVLSCVRRLASKGLSLTKSTHTIVDAMKVLLASTCMR